MQPQGRTSTERSMIGPLMPTPATFPESKRKRGNPNWGRPIPAVPALPTEFELQARHLHLTARMATFVFSNQHIQLI